MTHDPSTCRGPSVRIKDSVAAEVRIMDPLAVVSAVCIRPVRMKNGMVVHLPDAASDKAVVVINFLPIALDIARTYSHGMGILAHKVRAVHELARLTHALANIVKLRHRRIHSRCNIIGLALGVDLAFVLNRDIGHALEELVRGICVAAASAFVTKAPHDNRGCYGLVAKIVAHRAAEISALPGRVV